jgi:hypothetical protein
MIDENKTFTMFRYTSNTLKPYSSKKIWCICNVCKEKRLIQYRNYTNLCLKCSHKTDDYRKKQSKNNSGKNHPMYGKHHSNETKQKQSKALIGKNNPRWKGGKKLRFARMSAKRRKLFGFIPHNKPQKDFHGHHIDLNHVIFIPKELHMSISHSVINDINMDLINNLVCDWYLEYQIVI